MMPPGYYAGQQPVQFTASDQSTLNTLAIFHFIYAFLISLGAIGLLAAVALGFGLVASADHLHGPGILTGGVFMVLLLIVAAVLFVKAAVVFFSAVGLRKARHQTLSQIVACICCLNFPLGTILGVFTLIALSRPSVRALYEYRANGGV
ncbi:MAG TPA: hypothetical protein VNN72_02090 [Polyangiaceae bacterium]|nr:hypothetical protein [Polyangiaceae bacterium]